MFRADPRATNNLGFTPLHLSADKEDVTELLVKCEVEVSARAHDGSTPLHLAQTKSIAQLLLQHGAEINAQANDGGTPLDWASRASKRGPAKAIKDSGGLRKDPKTRRKTSTKTATEPGGLESHNDQWSFKI